MSSAVPYKPVKANTIVGWLKKVLARSGVDTTIWSAHSTRGASTSKQSGGVSVSTILSTACWKRVGTFRKFYIRPLQNEDRKSFARTVLS